MGSRYGRRKLYCSPRCKYRARRLAAAHPQPDAYLPANGRWLPGQFDRYWQGEMAATEQS
jgi:hypothetical protein